MLTRWITTADKPAWMALSKEYDREISEIACLTAFYDGFDEYMNRKIAQNEAAMAVDRITGECRGIIAFSRNHNRITFFAISQNADYDAASESLLTVALSRLDANKDIIVHLPKSETERLKRDRSFLEKNGFSVTEDNLVFNKTPHIALVRNLNLK